MEKDTIEDKIKFFYNNNFFTGIHSHDYCYNSR